MSSNLSRRLLLQVGLGGAATALLAACAPPPAAQPTVTAGAAPTAAPAATPAQAAAPLTAGAIIVRFHCREGDLSNHFVEYAKRYNAKNQKVNVKVEPMVATTEYWLKLSALYSTKTLGDAVVDISRFFPEMAYKGLYQDVAPFIKTDNFDLSQYYPGAIENTKFDATQYGLPETYQYQAVMIYYNKDLFDAAKVDYPTELTATFDEIAQKAQKLTISASTQFGISGASGAHHIIIRSFGGDVLDDTRKKSRLSEPPAIQATNWIRDLLYTTKVHPTASQIVNGSDTNMFAGGKIAMLLSTLWTGTFLIPLVANHFKYGAALLPKGPTGVMGNHSQSDLVALTSQSKDPQSAWQIVKYMTAKDIGIEKVSLNAGGPGARPDVQGDPGLQDKMIGLKQFQAALKEGRKPFQEPKPWNTRSQELNDVFGQGTDPIWLNKVAVTDGLKTLSDSAQKVLDKPRP